MAFLERFVHRRPALYAAKHAIANGLKRGVLRLFGLERRVARDRQRWRADFEALLRQHVAGKRVLEVGCGEGALIAGLCRDHGCDATGVDLSPAMIGLARERNRGPRYAVMDGGRLAFPDDAFDVIVFNQVLHHVRDIDAVVAEARRVGGAVLVVDPCPFPRQPLRALCRAYWAVTDAGERYLTLDEWRDAFALAEVARAADRGLVRNAAVMLARAGAIRTIPYRDEPR